MAQQNHQGQLGQVALPVNCKRYQHSKSISQCEHGELVLFDFFGSNVLAVTGTKEKNKIPVLILEEVGDETHWSNLPIAIDIDATEDGCISYGTSWIIDAIPSLSDKNVYSGYREIAGTLLLGNDSTHMTVYMKHFGGSAERRHFDLDNMKRQDSFEEMRSTCKHWRIWLSQEEMEIGSKDPIFEFDRRSEA